MIWKLTLAGAAIVFIILAIKFLYGIVRTVVSIALILFAIGMVVWYVAGEQITATGAAIHNDYQKTVKTINHTVNETVSLVVALPDKARASLPTDEE